MSEPARPWFGLPYAPTTIDSEGTAMTASRIAAFWAARRSRRLAASSAVSALLLALPAAPVSAAADSISGVLTDATTGAPIVGCVEVVDPKGGSSPLVAWGCSDTTGRYSAMPTAPGPLASGTWIVRGYDDTGAHGEVERSVTVTDAGPGPVDLALPQTATLTGRVLDRRTHAPIVGACPYAYYGRTTRLVGHQRTDCTDARGNWTLTGIPPADVTVFVSGDASHIGRWSRDAETQSTATLFTARSRRTTNTGTLAERHGGTLRGRITDTAGNPVSNAWVIVGSYDTFPGDFDQPGVETVTDASGRYTLTNVQPGRSAVLVKSGPDSHLAWQWSGNAMQQSDAERLSFAYEQTTRFDAVLLPEALLTVSAGAGLPGQYVTVDVVTADGSWVGYHNEFGPGAPAVAIHGLPATAVAVQLHSAAGSFWYDRAATRDAAKVLSLSATTPTSIVVSAP